MCSVGRADPASSDIFLGLNFVRIVSIIACLLVLASSIVTMVQDVEAVNDFIEAQKTNATLAEDLLDCDYVA
jgi:hypothetical protein